MAGIKVGDIAQVIKDDRATDEQFGEFFRNKIGEVGKVTYVDRELISLKFSDDLNSIAYWRSEVKLVKSEIERS